MSFAAGQGYGLRFLPRLVENRVLMARAVDPGVFQFESPIKIANPLGLCASSRDDDVDASPEIPRTDNVGFGTRKQPGAEKKQEEGCHIS